GFLGPDGDAFTMIPANLGAPTVAGLPPDGTPEYFVSESFQGYHWNVRKLTAGPDCGRGGKLSAATQVGQSSYSLIGGDIVRQPPPDDGTHSLESGIDRVMQKVQYRRVGRAESLWVAHAIVPGYALTVAPQWAQINVTRRRVSSS